MIPRGDRVTFPLEVVNEYRPGYRSYDIFPDYSETEFAPYAVGEFIYVRHFSIRVAEIVEVSHFDCTTGPEKTPDGKLAQYRVRLLKPDGTFSKRMIWATPYKIMRAYECTYSQTGEKRSFPPFLIEAFVKELRKW